MAKLEIRLLGPVEASRDGEPVRLGGAKQRAALAVLALDAGRVVSAERLIDALWGSFPPPTASTALHGHVSRLRGLLGADAIETRPPGYALTIEPDAVDALRFELLLAARQLSAGLALWRGDALADVAGEPGLGDQARRLDELRLTAEEDLIDSELELGHHVELVPRLEERVSRDRLRERGVAQLVVALYRSGRPGDALAAYAALRARLREDVGLDPSPELRELERRVLVQDPSLAPPSAAPGPTPPRRVPVTAVAVELAAAASDAEVYGRTIGEAREAVRLVLEHHGASVQQPAGALVLGVFGIPAPHEDDAARALRAANEAVALGARVAVASGEAFGGETPAAAEALRRLNGGASLDVDELTHARARPRRHHGAPLVGREAEHSALRDAYASCVRDRKSRLIAVVGPPGIGKSRLVAELLASVGEEPSVLLARCLSYGDGVSLLPAIELVRSAAGIEANVRATDAAERLETLLAGDERSAAAVEQLLRLLGYGDDPPDEESSWAVRRLLECVAQRRPVVAVLDDLHWGSPPIHDLARQLGEAADVPLLTIVTARETPAGSTADVIELRPLDALACTAVVAALLDAAPADPATVGELVRASGGNPLFLEELVLSLRAGDAGP
ncbi:MAG TPA: BTAD domain-containing putative transcriptional regulator, partial [Gaiellaceae bacterium]|nr:BTAD domain-containing putative transcriptional regulator [Gaiellaceae bacterium]